MRREQIWIKEYDLTDESKMTMLRSRDLIHREESRSSGEILAIAIAVAPATLQLRQRLRLLTATLLIARTAA